MPTTQAEQIASLPKLHEVSTEHPRVLGSREQLRALAAARPQAWKRTRDFALQPMQADHFYAVLGKLLGTGLIYAIEGKAPDVRDTIDYVLDKHIRQPVETGHVTFAHTLARCAFIYDLCHDQWTQSERREFHDYFNATVDANVNEEVSTLHNAWYGYKNWGYGMASYATFYENPRAEKILRDMENDYLTRAVPALQMAGDGGGWAEGFYIHYWLYEWLFFCESARLCEGADYYATAPNFYPKRAIASMFETFPGFAEEGTRRNIPMGDGGGRKLSREYERDKALISRRILVNRFRDGPAHQAVNAFNQSTPQCVYPYHAYKDFLFNDPTVPVGELKSFQKSHFAPGAGFVYARDDWSEQSAHFFFKCGRRFTSHQHLDNGHFGIFKHEELLGDAGHYEWNADHGVNIYLRTIAHNCILIHDPDERWPDGESGTVQNIRAGAKAVNDGGQNYPWIGTSWRHNGAAWDVQHWMESRELGEIATMLAYEDKGDHVYMAGDYTKSYSSKKLKEITRQIVFLRPGKFVVFDRIETTRPEFKNTFLLQAMQPPTTQGDNLVITNGKGRLFVQTLLPAKAQIDRYEGNRLYTYNGVDHPTTINNGPGPECRVEISAVEPSTTTYFLHVLTTTDPTVESVPQGAANITDKEVNLRLDGTTLTFQLQRVGFSIKNN